MAISFHGISVSIPTLPRTAVFVGRHNGRIFFFGFVLFSLLGVFLFYFFGYRFTQQSYINPTHLQGVNRELLAQTLQDLQAQQSKATGAPAANPFAP